LPNEQWKPIIVEEGTEKAHKIGETTVGRICNGKPGRKGLLFRFEYVLKHVIDEDTDEDIDEDIDDDMNEISEEDEPKKRKSSFESSKEFAKRVKF